MIKANDVKKYLRENGVDTKKISVRYEIVGFSSAIRVTLKDMMLDNKLIEALLIDKYEKISRCEVSGEILEGGNTYVDVVYDCEVEQEYKQLLQNKYTQPIKELETNHEVEVVNGKYEIYVYNDKNNTYNICLLNNVSGNIVLTHIRNGFRFIPSMFMNYLVEMERLIYLDNKFTEIA